MKKVSVALVAACIVALTGCNEEKKAEDDVKTEAPKAEVVQTVDWYKAHKDERRAMLDRCHNNPGELAATPNCVNASRAESSATWGSRTGGHRIEPLTASEMNVRK